MESYFDALREAVIKAPSPEEADNLVRVVVPAPVVMSLPGWLSGVRVQPRIYWSDRNADFELAGVGSAAEACGEPHQLAEELKALIKKGSGDLKFFGGVAFNPFTPVESPWESLGPCRFILPRITWSRQDGIDELACHFGGGKDREEALAFLDELNASMPGQVDEPLLTRREDRPDREAWRQMVNQTLGQIREGHVEKVVLARAAQFSFDRHLDPFRLLDAVRKRTPGCFHFAYQFAPETAFIGASPERLFKVAEGAVQTEAVAGTRPQHGQSETDDEALCKELLDSEKDLREHQFVRDHIQKKLEPMCSNFSADPVPQLKKLRQSVHLMSRFSGSLKDEYNPQDLLLALHPTPAVGGSPRLAAMLQIEASEPFDRGWYTGPLGWVSRESSECCVAIRCGLVHRDRITLYSGAGIVEGSDPDSEWDEIENKVADFTRILGYA